MEEIEQPRRIGGLLVAVAVLLAAAAIWGTVALASGSGSSSSPDPSVPVAGHSGGGQSVAAPGDRHGNCPHENGQSTTPSSPTTPSTPSTDGSSNPTL